MVVRVEKAITSQKLYF